MRSDKNAATLSLLTLVVLLLAPAGVAARSLVRGERAPAGLVPGDGALAEGELRARVRRVPGRIDLTFWFRSVIAEHRRAVRRGWGLRLDGDRAYFVRRDRAGAARRHGGIAYLLGLRGRGRLELVAWLHGPHVVAAVYDRALRRRFATLAMRIPAPRRGEAGFGVELGPRGTPVRAVDLTGRRRLCRAGPRLPEPPRLFATVDGAPVASRDGTLMEKRGDGALVLRTDLTRLERLVCAGARLRAVTAHRPWKYVGAGADYLAARNSAPPLTKAGTPALWRSYKNPAMVEALLRRWHRRHPRRTRLVTLGRSHGGRPLLALQIGDGLRPGDPRPTVLLNGGHHGTEPLSVEVVLDAIQQLLGEGALARRARRELAVWAVPVVNPDGLQHYLEVSLQMGRKNGRDENGDGIVGVYEGVDLNRNYPVGWKIRVQSRDTRRRDWHYYRGPAPASEPEVRAMIALAARERFAASLSYHSGSIALHLPYTAAGLACPLPDEAGAVGYEIARALGVHPQGRRFGLLRTIASVSGSDQDHYRHAHGTLALLVEAARRTPRPGKELATVVKALRPSWQQLLRRYLDGPTVWGHVRDARGRPTEAEVRLAEVRLRAGERWTARPRDGRFDRILARPGRYRLQVIPLGHARPALERVVEVGRRQRLRVELRLP